MDFSDSFYHIYIFNWKNKKMTDYTPDQFFTTDQIKAIKKVERALADARKLGVEFWDDYGTLAAYSRYNITNPCPLVRLQDMNGKTELESGVMSYNLNAKNFHPGNADDTLHVEILKLNS